MKHKLKLEDLAVETFATTPDAPRGRGTVRAFADTTACLVEDTQAEDCNFTLDVSGGVDTCASMGGDPCVYFCDVTQRHFFTCGAVSCGGDAPCYA